MNEYNGYSKTEILESILLSDNVVNSINENMDLFLKILPEIENLISFDKTHQGQSVWKNTLCSLRLSKKDLDVRLALLFNDMSKPYTYSNNDGVEGFKGHATASSIIAKHVLSRIGYAESYVNKICYLIQMHNRPIDIKKLNGDEDLQLKIIEIKRCSNIEFNKEVKSDIKMSK